MEFSPMVVPLNRLPAGYSKTIGPTSRIPVTPRPAATLALLRKCTEGMEVLLLKRGSGTRFLPGAYVFPGGRVDREDGGGGLRSHAITALRETFEEAGILPGSYGECLAFPLEGRSRGSRIRREVQRGSGSFSDALEELGISIDPDSLTLVGHWVTPVQEPFRYDTRFFAVEVPEECPAYPDGVEMVEATWSTPERALEENRAGRLPMVFPTLLTLRALSEFDSPQQALRTLAGKIIPRLLPRVERAGDAVRMTLEGA
jgi:8-oxo-dGTP pyrophosphatase MutT (NUDIX family)